MRHLLVLLASLASLTLGACDRRWLRDDYMGRDLLQPELTPQPAPRDDQGNPVLTPQTPR